MVLFYPRLPVVAMFGLEPKHTDANVQNVDAIPKL